jgi:hypothetical protein
MGRLIMAAQLSDRYEGVCDAARKAAQPLERIESQSLQIDHCDVLCKALEHWKFPRDFILPVISHHWSAERLKRLDCEHRDASATIALANRIAHAMLLGDSGDEALHPFDELIELLQLRSSIIPQIVASVSAETNDLKIAMLARSEAGAWPSFREKTQARLTKPARVLCVSNGPDMDVYRIFFETLAPAFAGTSPNLGVLYHGDQIHDSKLTAKFEDAERAAGVKDIPIIYIHNKRDNRVDDAWLRARRHRVLNTPVCISAVLSTMEELLDAAGQ